MDTTIMNLMIESCGDVSLLEKLKKSTNLIDESQFPSIDDEKIGALAKSFSNLLGYSVSRQLYQRHAIQMQIVKIFQEWTEIKGFQKLVNFTEGSETLNLAMRMLKKQLTQKKLQETCSENLEFLARLMFALSSKDSSLLQPLNQVVLHLLESKPSESSNTFLQSFISSLKTENHVIEKVYLTRKSNFIEKPLIDNFVSFLSHNDFNEFQGDDFFKQLLEKCVQFPLIFRLSCEYLKNFLKESEYSKIAVNYSQFFVQKIQLVCELKAVDILDLYPENLQGCVALMRIEEKLHSTSSKNLVCEAAKNVFLKSSDDLVILVSHFPDWLENISRALAESEPSHESSMECSY